MAIGWLTLGVFSGLTLFAAWQIVPAILRVRRSPVVTTAGRSWPRVEVILSLKGLDPFLERCLERLVSQDYPNYRVTVVVDSMDDPAWPQAKAAQATFGPHLIDLKVRTHRSTTCTRKLCNLLTAFEALPREVEIVALCDGDAVVHESWLMELIAGLDDSQMAAVGGNRWYSPPASDIASLSRHYWNAIAIPNTDQYGILWAGSLAMRRTIVDEPAFRAAFEHGFADDTVLAKYLAETGRKTRLLESLYVVNSETTTLRSYWNFLVRQMLCVRIHHPNWMPIFVHALCLAIGLGALTTSAALGSVMDIALAGSGLVLYGAVLIGVLHAYDLTLRRKFRERAALQVPFDIHRLAMLVPALLLTSVIYPAATIVAAWARRHVWRGVEYHLRDGKVVRAVDLELVPILPLGAPGQAIEAKAEERVA